MAEYSFAQSAVIDTSFAEGRSGVYDIYVTLPAHRMDQELRSVLDKSIWESEFRRRGLDASVQRIRAATPGISNERYRNPALCLIPKGWPGHDCTALADLHYVITVAVGARAASGLSGFGVAPAAVGAIALGVLAAVAVGWKVYASISGSNLPNPVFPAVRKVGELTGGVVKDVAKGAAEGGRSFLLNAVLAVGVVGGLAWVLTRSRTKIRTGVFDFGR